MAERDVGPCLLTDLYHIFSAPRRCYVIQLLSQRDRQEYSVRELSREIAAIEQGVPKSHATGEPYRNVYNALSQTHLSSMVDLDLVTYHQDRQTVTPRTCLRRAALLIHFDLMTYLLLTGQSLTDGDKIKPSLGNLQTE